MMTVILDKPCVVDGRLREAGEVVRVPESFDPSYIREVISYE